MTLLSELLQLASMRKLGTIREERAKALEGVQNELFLIDSEIERRKEENGNEKEEEAA